MAIIRPLAAEDRTAALSLAADSGLFDPDGLALVDARLVAHFAGDAGAWWMARVDARPAGLLYAAPEPLADRAWNALMLVVAPSARGRGVGAALMRHFEASTPARLLLVETSGVPAFAAQRAFYAGLGYAEVARIPDYYADSDDKVVFARRPKQA